MNIQLNNYSLRKMTGILFLFSCLSGYMSSASADQTIEKTFDVAAGGELVIETERGSISVATHKDNLIKASVVMEGIEQDEFELEFKHSGDSLTISGSNTRDLKNRWGKRKVHFDIVIPEQFNVNVSTRGGSIKVAGVTGKVDATTSGGSLNFQDITGNLDGSTSGGSIRVESVQGDTRIRTSGGSIKVDSVSGDLWGRTSGGSIKLAAVAGEINVATSGGSIKVENVEGQIMAKTSGGSIKANFSQLTAHSELHTSAGSITVSLADDIKADIDARGGSISSDFEIDGKKKARRKLQGAINGGGPKLELHTSAGGVKIYRK